MKSGYGRNYLIPTGKAVIASPSAKKMLAEELKQRAHKLEKIKKDAEALAAKLEGESAPEQCPICKAPADKFVEQSGDDLLLIVHI